MTYLYRYSRWDGSGAPGHGDADAVLAALTDGLLRGGDVQAVLKDIVRHGVSLGSETLPGMDALLEQVKHTQTGVSRAGDALALDELRRRVTEVLALERSGLERRLRDARARGAEVPSRGGGLGGVADSLLRHLEERVAADTAFIESLSDDPSDAMQRLLSYEFTDEEARSRFGALAEALRRPAREAALRAAAQRLGSDVVGARRGIGSAAADLIGALNGDADALARAVASWGGRLGPIPPASAEELGQRMKAELDRVAEALGALSDAARAEVQAAVDSVLADETVRRQVEELAAQMERMVGATDLGPFAIWMTPWDEDNLDEALKGLRRQQDLATLEKGLSQGIEQGSADIVDAALTRAALGDDAGEVLETLQSLVRRLAEAGYVQIESDRLHLTPRAARRIGERTLGTIFVGASQGGAGSHTTHHTGFGGDETFETKPYEFGDTFALDARESVAEAVLRCPGLPVRLRPEDLRVRRTEARVRAATVLALDLSKSMVEHGHFVPAKKVALALDALVRSRFASDDLYIIGFSTYARRVLPDDLATLTWDEFDPYTNIQHALSEGRALLSRRGDGLRQIILITDGEPTAHCEGGHVVHKFPTSSRTLGATLLEARRCASAGIVVNTFMLGARAGAFVTAMGEAARGRVFAVDPARLGEYVVLDFLRRRQAA